MNDETRFLISTYVDGELPPERAAEVEALLAADPRAAALARELTEIGTLFGHGEPEPLPTDLRARLLDLETVPPVEDFEPVALPPVRRLPWARWANGAAAAAALVLAIVGLNALTWRPVVAVHEVARMTLAADGSVASVDRSRRLDLRAGADVRTGPGERLSFRLDGGTAVVLQPGTGIALGDPRADELFTIEEGTALCTVADSGRPRTVRAGVYAIHVARADFGVRLETHPVRSAGPARAARAPARVLVAVSVGEVEVGRNGDRERVRASESLTLRPGAPAERGDARATGLYRELMESFRVFARELLPGYFDAEPGVTPLSASRWVRLPDGGRELVLTDGGRGAQAGWLVVRVRATRPTRATLTLVRPRGPGEAGTVTLPVGPVGTAWSVHAVPLAGFRAPGADRELRTIPAGRSALARLELRPAEPGVAIELKTSLWAARPPAGDPGPGPENAFERTRSAEKREIEEKR